ncbi:isochorismatase family protein [Salicibibacter cibarius]|uniref:Isochorismatase family protein n=1 Tax=Salicibibacter cibarius TaxID=2743000 RepID=A0A7T6Z6B9_9BACI|nr:isochorismatase family protein [Salicibibacter cibarius]QQK77805.1 isochorismatase family protein [Salicibibacter cibarius]
MSKLITQQGGFGQHPAIVVVDVIKGFTDPYCELGSNYTSLLMQLKKLLQSARKKSYPIFFTTVVYENEAEGGQFIKKVPSLRVLTSESEWIQVDPHLDRNPQEPLLMKKYASAFFGTSLFSMLTTQGVDTVIVTGVTTSGCVRATAVDALQYGYKVVIPKECVGDRMQEPHEASLFDINKKYGDVVTTEKVLHYMENN